MFCVLLNNEADGTLSHPLLEMWKFQRTCCLARAGNTVSVTCLESRFHLSSFSL